MAESTTDRAAIESVLHEERLFEPPPTFSNAVGGAYITSMEQYRELYERSIRDPEGFWSQIARELDWFREWDKVLEWEPPDARWFIGGRTNLCHNCVDRQVNHGHGNEVD